MKKILILFLTTSVILFCKQTSNNLLKYLEEQTVIFNSTLQGVSSDTGLTII